MNEYEREIEEKILEEYILHYRVEAESYRMMGKMLDEQLVKKRLELYEISDMYIYGGTYLAVQLYRAVGNNANIRGIADKAGKIIVKVNVPVLTLEDLKKESQNEMVIITPPIFYKEIKSELLTFIEEKNILFLGEFLEGLR